MSAMKANPVRQWDIILWGRKQAKSRRFIGRLDEALAYADEMESGVRFAVLEYTIKRVERVKKAKAA